MSTAIAPRGAWGRHTRLALLLPLTVAACSRSFDPLERATRDIRSADIQKYGATLSSDAMSGRRHASPEADSVVSYLVAQLRGMGIEPRQRAEQLLAGEPGSFEHYFDVTLSRVGHRTRLSALCDDRTHHAVAGEGFLPLVFSRPDDVIGPAVQLAAAAELLQDESAATVRGRIVLAAPETLRQTAGEPLDAALYRAARRLTELGAAAVLFEEVETWQRLSSTTYPNALADLEIERLQAPDARRTPGNLERYATIRQARAWRAAPQRTIPALVLAPGVSLTAFECGELRVRVAFDHEVSLGRNVLVAFTGADRAPETIVLTAHYDQAGITRAGDAVLGANDNATGVAALLSVAGALYDVRERLHGSVLLAFVGAELLGGLGTETLLRDWPRLLAGATPQLCLDIEAIGLNGAQNVQVVGAASDPSVLRVLQRHNRRASLQAGALLLEPQRFRPPAPGLQFQSGPHLYTLAHWRNSGVPSWTLHDGAEPRSPGDDGWKAVRTGKVTRLARLLFRTTYELATAAREDARPAGL
jgi:hypothetical protein